MTIFYSSSSQEMMLLSFLLEFVVEMIMELALSSYEDGEVIISPNSKSTGLEYFGHLEQQMVVWVVRQINVHALMLA